MSISIDATKNEDGVVVAVAGEIDVSNAPELRSALDEALGEGAQSLEVDLSQVPYIDSTGIGVLVGLAHRASEVSARLTVSHPQPGVARVLTLLGMGDELGIVE